MKEQDFKRQVITLPLSRKADWRDVLPTQLRKVNQGPIELDCKDWLLGCRDFKKLSSLLERFNLRITSVHSSVQETVVTAAALGHQAHLDLLKKNVSPEDEKNNDLPTKYLPELIFHQGTLRSGEHLEVEGDILLLGDVNPGAKVSAGGDVMIWGRLRGIAHAGKKGNKFSKIVALELRPLQLRIADEIARGPEEKPEEGLAEEARLENGKIFIKPAQAHIFKH